MSIIVSLVSRRYVSSGLVARSVSFFSSLESYRLSRTITTVSSIESSSMTLSLLSV